MSDDASEWRCCAPLVRCCSPTWRSALSLVLVTLFFVSNMVLMALSLVFVVLKWSTRAPPLLHWTSAQVLSPIIALAALDIVPLLLCIAWVCIRDSVACVRSAYRAQTQQNVHIDGIVGALVAPRVTSPQVRDIV